MLSVGFSLYLASILVGKFEGKGVCEIGVKEGVEGSERVSGIDKDVSDEMSVDHSLNLVRLGEKHMSPN